ncbi:MAG: Sapep family Mn(2+)-dependent dipeptidase [Oscillospiraceae bacterium]|nr:Sapep family Mn(2+)-dependent dipeptidase [Oscillospiraceae bacterium]
MSKTKEEIRIDIEKWFQAHGDEMIEDLGKLISINSVKGSEEEGAPYGAGPKAALMLVQSILENRGFDVELFENIVICSQIGPSPPLMGILAHVDVVGTGDGWDTDPFTMVIKEDGNIYGRGATDNKGPAMAAIYAMFCARELMPEPSSGVQLILGSGEEQGCLDIAQYLEKNETPPNVFTPDADYPIVNTEKGRFTPFFSASWEKDTNTPRVVSIIGGNTTNVVPNVAEAIIEGFTLDEAKEYCDKYFENADTKASLRIEGNQLIITVDGASAHAATPDLGANAQTAILGLLASMPFADSEGYKYICALSKLFPHGDYYGAALGIEMSDEISGELTVNFGVLRFSELEFSANFDSRTPAIADEVDLLSIVEEAFNSEGISMTGHTINQCHHTPADSPLVQTLLSIYEAYTGNKGECLCVGGQTYVHELPGGVAFGTGEDGVDNRIHGANEYIGKDHLMQSAMMFAQAILEMCS